MSKRIEERALTPEQKEMLGKLNHRMKSLASDIDKKLSEDGLELFVSYIRFTKDPKKSLNERWGSIFDGSGGDLPEGGCCCCDGPFEMDPECPCSC